MMAHYHIAADDGILSFDTASGGAGGDGELPGGQGIANADQRPRWKKDDFFGRLQGNALTLPDQETLYETPV